MTTAKEQIVTIGPEDDPWLPKFATRCLQTLGPANDGDGPYACAYHPVPIDVAQQRFGGIDVLTHQDSISQKAAELGGDPNCANWITFASLQLLQEL